MKDFQKVIKYIAIVFACFLVVLIFSTIIKVIFTFSVITNDKEYDYQSIDELDINSNVDRLSIDLAMTNLNIIEGEEFKVDTNNQYIKVSTNNNELVIKEVKHKLYKSDRSDLNIYIPKDYVIKKTNIDSGAGKIKIDSLVTNRLELDLGAGTTAIDNIDVLDDTEIDTGAGKVTINDTTFNNLDLDVGVGSVIVNAKILGRSEIDAGVGSLKINLLDNKDNYMIKASKGIGSFKIDNQNISDNSTYGDGANSIRITGGVGSINVSFDNYTLNDTFTKTYTVINKITSDEDNKYYVTLKMFQGGVETVLIEDEEDLLKEDKTYEFNFIGTDSNDIKEVFKNKLVSFKETNKTGLEQIN